MFIDTYYDERSEFSAGSGEPAIPYPELVGEELSLWQKYLPVRTELEPLPGGSTTVCLNLSKSN
jgi:hypothetical protein